MEGGIEETVSLRELGVAHGINRRLEWPFRYSFLDPGSVAERGLDSEPGTTPFNICCFSLDLRVLHQLEKKQMRKRFISRAWCSLSLQQRLSHLPTVCNRELILRFYGSPSLTVTLLQCTCFRKFCLTQCCDLARSRARNEFLLKCCCLK